MRITPLRPRQCKSCEVMIKAGWWSFLVASLLSQLCMLLGGVIALTIYGSFSNIWEAIAVFTIGMIVSCPVLLYVHINLVSLVAKDA